MATPLPNLLLSHRKRSALSQEDMAFLLGTRGGSKVSRYERFKRGPNLETVLAYEAIFGKPASQLFAGQYREVENSMGERVRVLIHKTKRQKTGTYDEEEARSLGAILAPAIEVIFKTTMKYKKPPYQRVLAIVHCRAGDSVSATCSMESSSSGTGVARCSAGT